MLACLALLVQQTPSAADAPPTRSLALGLWHDLVPHDARRTLLLVNGGPETGKPPGEPLELWEWRADGWHLVAADESGPRWRNLASVAYDSRRARLVLHGGVQGELELGDTWEWDGERWRAFDGAGPGPREGAGMTYDAPRARTLLFGGASSGAMQGDTWAWDGERWERVATTGPGARFPAGFVGLPSHEVVLLFGGHAATPAGFRTFGDTWIWDGERWEELDGAGPSPRDGARAAYDPERGGALLFGGAELGAGVVLLGDTWRWDGAWERLALDGPPARVHPALAYDAAGKRFVLCGGSHGVGAVRDDVWQLADGRWTCLRGCP